MRRWKKAYFWCLFLFLGLGAACSDRSTPTDGVVDLVNSRSPSQFGIDIEGNGFASETVDLGSSKTLKLKISDEYVLELDSIEHLRLVFEYGQLATVNMMLSPVSRDRVGEYFTAMCDEFGLTGSDLDEWRTKGERTGFQDLSAGREFWGDSVGIYLNIKFPHSSTQVLDSTPTFAVLFVQDRDRERWERKAEAARAAGSEGPD